MQAIEAFLEVEIELRDIFEASCSLHDHFPRRRLSGMGKDKQPLPKTLWSSASETRHRIALLIRLRGSVVRRGTEDSTHISSRLHPVTHLGKKKILRVIYFNDFLDCSDE